MARRFHFHEDYQLTAKIVRCVVWSSTMGFLWGLPCLLLLLNGWFSFKQMPKPQNSEDSLEVLGFTLLLAFGVVISLCAIIVGGAKGFKQSLGANPSDSVWPFSIR